MDNAFENENLENQGQVNDNMGRITVKHRMIKIQQIGNLLQYLQSEKDKLHAENQNSKNMKKLDNCWNHDQISCKQYQE